MKVRFEAAKTATRTAEDHAQALSIQLDDLREEAEKAEILADEKRHIAASTKKKGFRRSGSSKASVSYIFWLKTLYVVVTLNLALT